MTIPDSPYDWQASTPDRQLSLTDGRTPTPLPPTLSMPLPPLPPQPAALPVLPLPVPVPTPMAVPVPQKSAGAAIALELVLGLLGIFGVGNLYAGSTATGVILMLSFWAMFWVNLFLMIVVIGLVTMPLTWLGYLVLAPLLAARSVERHNARALAWHPTF